YRLSNGSRSISHDTNMQDFLAKFGFRKEYCLLRVAYRPVVDLAVRALYPFRGLISSLQGRRAQPVSAILFQEELKRRCVAGALLQPAMRK
ncbi:MAG: hypothetical protein NUV35_09390, partial [Syntrophomonadaceae bacterium]|nr:hypothetical protein [Syntrophomonadaceae bacterium]